MRAFIDVDRKYICINESVDSTQIDASSIRKEAVQSGFPASEISQIHQQFRI